MRRIYYYKGLDAKEVKEKLRREGIRVVDVRVCKYVEVDFFADDEEKVLKILGKPLFTDCEKCSFEELFFDYRFWEAHEKLEAKWRVEKDLIKKKYLQSLILISASLVKYCKGEVEVSDQLLSKALSLISELPEELLPLLYVSLSLNS